MLKQGSPSWAVWVCWLFNLCLLEQGDAALWDADNGPWMSRIGLPSRKVHYSPLIMNYSAVLTRLCHFGGWNGLLGVWLLLPMQNWDFRLSHHLGPELYLLGCWQVSGFPSALCPWEGSIPEICFAKVHFRMELADFDLPISWLMLSSHSSFTIPLTSLDPSFSHSFIEKKKKCFKITEYCLRRMNNKGKVII